MIEEAPLAMFKIQQKKLQQNLSFEYVDKGKI